jgi:hypothetical protein
MRTFSDYNSRGKPDGGAFVRLIGASFGFGIQVQMAV